MRYRYLRPEEIAQHVRTLVALLENTNMLSSSQTGQFTAFFNFSSKGASLLLGFKDITLICTQICSYIHITEIKPSIHNRQIFLLLSLFSFV